MLEVESDCYGNILAILFGIDEDETQPRIKENS